MSEEQSPTLSSRQLSALRQVGKDIEELSRVIIEAQKRINELQLAANAIAGKSIQRKRPWEVVLEAVIDAKKPITVEEALSVAMLTSNIGTSLKPLDDFRKSISGSRQLKCVNNMVGLTEWPDEAFKE